MRRVPAAVAVLLAALPPLAGCGHDEPRAKALPRIVSTEVAAGRMVRLTDAGPVPKRIVAGPGDRITWRNESFRPREVRLMDGTVASGPIAPGGDYAHTFPTSGTFAYQFGPLPAADGGSGAKKPNAKGRGKTTPPVPDGVVEINLPAVQSRP